MQLLKNDATTSRNIVFILQSEPYETRARSETQRI
jgi:hypothetical protein